MRTLIASLIGIASGAVSFALICLIFDQSGKEHLVLATLLGAFVGLLAAPECSPESFRHPKIFQVLSGIGVGLSVGLYFNASITYTAALCIIGAVIGFFANQITSSIYVP